MATLSATKLGQSSVCDWILGEVWIRLGTLVSLCTDVDSRVDGLLWASESCVANMSRIHTLLSNVGTIVAICAQIAIVNVHSVGLIGVSAGWARDWHGGSCWAIVTSWTVNGGSGGSSGTVVALRAGVIWSSKPRSCALISWGALNHDWSSLWTVVTGLALSSDVTSSGIINKITCCVGCTSWGCFKRS
jgi:hypothetical protein